MNEPGFQAAFAEQNRRDYIASATLGTFVSIPLNLYCCFMDHYMYPGKADLFLKARLVSVLVTAFAWLWFKTSFGRAHPRYEIAWFMSPLIMILFMVYQTDDPYTPYYAGLNIILLGMGLLSPWAYVQNLLASIFVLVMYLVISFLPHNAQSISSIMNNSTFIMLTAVLVVCGSVASSRQRFREFSLRYELDKNRKSLEETNRKLVELDRLKSRFFANVSHELRTPLTLLIAPLETLLHRHAKSLDANAREMLHTMHSNGLRLLKLINDLLDLIRLESGRLEVSPEPVAMREFIEGLASAVRTVAANKRIFLETTVAPEMGIVLVDRDKLEKIILNLLFNSLKFTPENGKVWFRVEKQADKLALIVSDTGVGIAEKNLPFVFDRFWQADGSSNRKFQGVGIGLALVKELVDIQGGTVAVQSEEGKGATFTVCLPYVPSELPATNLPAKTSAVLPPPVEKPVESEEWLANLYRRAELFSVAPGPDQADAIPANASRAFRPMVLVADDEPDMRRFLRSQLEDEYEVMEAVDGLMATERAGQFLPDIILLDLMMPHKDGLQVCKELREIPATAGIPIILLTARADEEAKFDALQMGANDFLAKPFSSIELQARVKNLVERNHYQRRITKQNKDLTAAIEQIKETEMQLVQSEKLSSLGRMSAGIIHEINNPLNFTMTALFTLRNKAKYFPQEMRPEYEDILNDIEDGLKRVRNIVSDLRTFTHPGGGPGELVDTAESTAAALRFLAGEWKDRVNIEQHFPPAHVVWSNRNKLIHVLINLLQNSIDALQEKKFAPGETPTVTIKGHVKGTRSYLVIRDNGPGIDAKVVDKIFDPFFTTKEIGKGMGLGLSICYRIVHGYGGNISVQSERGSYCMFTLDFPLEYQPAQESEMMNG